MGDAVNMTENSWQNQNSRSPSCLCTRRRMRSTMGKRQDCGGASGVRWILTFFQNHTFVLICPWLEIISCNVVIIAFAKEGKMRTWFIGRCINIILIRKTWELSCFMRSRLARKKVCTCHLGQDFPPGDSSAATNHQQQLVDGFSSQQPIHQPTLQWPPPHPPPYPQPRDIRCLWF